MLYQLGSFSASGNPQRLYDITYSSVARRMEKIDEAVELAEEASPADSDAAKPFSGAQVAVDSPMLSSGLPTGALVTTQSSQMTKNDEVASELYLVCVAY